MENTIPFKKLSGIRNIASTFSQQGDDYILSRFTKATSVDLNVQQPVRVSGMSFCLLLKGNMALEINSNRYRLEPVSIMIVNEQTVLKISDIRWEEVDAYMLFISKQFIQDVNIDLNAINFSMMEEHPNHVIEQLTVDETALFKDYMELLYRHATMSEVSICTKNATRSLIQSLIYQLMQVKYDHTEIKPSTTDSTPNRRMGYVQEFMRLVQLHHSQERSLSFYADKLYISPKYLSSIIKESTGHSAADWIDQFVLHEAKNMLRFSNKNIQEVAYALNFTTQSSFGKFFKHLTGMSPSDYQKT